METQSEANVSVSSTPTAVVATGDINNNVFRSTRDLLESKQATNKAMIALHAKQAQEKIKALGIDIHYFKKQKFHTGHTGMVNINIFIFIFFII